MGLKEKRAVACPSEKCDREFLTEGRLCRHLRLDHEYVADQAEQIAREQFAQAHYVPPPVELVDLRKAAARPVLCPRASCLASYMTAEEMARHFQADHGVERRAAVAMAEVEFAPENGRPINYAPTGQVGGVGALLRRYLEDVRQDLALSRAVIEALTEAMVQLEEERKPLRVQYIQARAKLNQLEKERAALEAQAQGAEAAA